jgi:hypothetical protein
MSKAWEITRRRHYTEKKTMIEMYDGGESGAWEEDGEE